jgi:hypothetical protein
MVSEHNCIPYLKQHARSDSQLTLVDQASPERLSDCAGADTLDHQRACSTLHRSYGKTLLTVPTLRDGADEEETTHHHEDVCDSLLPREQLDIPSDDLVSQVKEYGRDEGVLVAKLVLPISMAGLLELVLSFMNVFALGHLGKTGMSSIAFFKLASMTNDSSRIGGGLFGGYICQCDWFRLLLGHEHRFRYAWIADLQRFQGSICFGCDAAKGAAGQLYDDDPRRIRVVSIYKSVSGSLYAKGTRMQGVC